MLDFRSRQLFHNEKALGHFHVYILLGEHERTIVVRGIATATYTTATCGRKCG